LRTNPGPSSSRSHPYTRAHPSAHASTCVRADTGTLAALSCSAATPNLGVDTAVPDTQAEPRLSLSRGNPLLGSSFALLMVVGTLDSFTAGKTPFAGRPLWGKSSSNLGSRLNPWGIFCTRWTTRGCGRSRSSGSGAARHSSLEPHVFMHRAPRQRISPGSRAVGHASRPHGLQLGF
jgi:hypothetical protein